MPSTRIESRKLGYLFACGIATLTALATISACKDDNAADHEHGDEHGDEHNPNAMVGPLTGATCPDGSTLSYDNFGKQFMQNYCLTCHSMSVTGTARNGAPPDHNFDELASIALLKNHIDELAGSGPSATNEMMPPAIATKKPTTDERKQLSEWLACGPK
jgi:hypothetical protein